MFRGTQAANDLVMEQWHNRLQWYSDSRVGVLLFPLGASAVTRRKTLTAKLEGMQAVTCRLHSYMPAYWRLRGGHAAATWRPRGGHVATKLEGMQTRAADGAGYMAVTRRSLGGDFDCHTVVTLTRRLRGRYRRR